MAVCALSNVLWTGGWDSTYMVLSLLDSGATVQPHYIQRSTRQSVTQELSAMEEVRAAMAARWRERLLPLIVIDDSSISVPQGWRECYSELVEGYGVGPQYLFLATYASTLGARLALGVHVDDKAHSVVRSAHRSLEQRQTLAMNDPRRLLLDFFEFPILDKSKLQMREDAKAKGWLSLLQKTWFCQLPTERGLPCGFCNPCQFTIDEGLGDRVPREHRARLWFYRRFARKLPSYRLRQGLLGLLMPKKPASRRER